MGRGSGHLKGLEGPLPGRHPHVARGTRPQVLAVWTLPGAVWASSARVGWSRRASCDSDPRLGTHCSVPPHCSEEHTPESGSHSRRRN